MKTYLTFSLLILFMGIASEVSSQCIAGKQVTLANGETSIDVCSSQRIKLRPGSNAGLNVFAITNDDGIIEAIQPKNIVDLSKLTPGSKRVYSISWFGVLHQPIGEDINSAVFADFCYELSTNFVSLNLVGGSTGEINPVNEIVCFDGAATVEANHINFSLGSGYELIYVLTKGAELVIQDVSAEPNFTVDKAGEYIIHPLVYDPMTLDLSIVELGVTTGFDVNGLLSQGGGDICASLDVAGAAVSVVDPSPGQLTPSIEGSICYSSNDVELMAEVVEQANIPEGYSSIYVLTMGPGLVIMDVSPEPSFTVSDAGLYTIHTLIYDPNTLDLGIVVPGETTGFDVNGLLVQGGGSICGRLDVAGAQFNIVNLNAGILEPQGESTICGGESSPLVAIVKESPTVPDGFSTLFVLTKGDDLTIMAVSDQPSFEVAENGHYTIHTLVYDPETLDLSIVEFGSTTGFDVNSLLVQGGGSICGSLLVDGATFNIVKPDAGTLTPTSDIACGDGSSILLEAERDGEAVIPDGFQLIYVLTSGAELVIQDASSSPSFSVNTGGLYTIHTLVYDPNTLDLGIIQFGTTTGVDVNGLLAQGGGTICASLDVAGATISANVPSAGTLMGGETVSCSSGAQTIEASVDQEAFLPEGYEQIYVLTEGSDLVIQAVNANPEFEVEQSGMYTIHSLVYDPLTLDLGIVVFGETTGFNVNELLVQGGGGICGALDVAGTVFSLGPDAGTLSASSSGCLSDGEVTLTAMSNGDAVVLDGFETLYVLTSGEELVIQQVSAEPAFTVQDEGLYTIHTLVYDPSTLDLAIVVPGVTTGVDVNGLLVQGGGQICASLDVAGAKFNVADPQAGTLVPVTSVFCASSDPITIEASAQGDAVVPDGYSTIYVLTSGDDLIIEAVSATPTFEVQAPNSYTIHTLVYDTSTLDLGIVQIGVTTGFDVNGLLAQGGGTICASLDVAGAKFSIGPSAGTLIASSIEGCNMDIILTAEIASSPYLPAGYEQLYVLTKGEGLVIEQVGPEPTFIVEENGMYTIHTLVYDPGTLDLSIVVPGETTGFDVNGLLIQGGGSICAALDVPGAGFTVSVADAGTLNAPFAFVCFEGSETTITAEVMEPASLPTGYSQIYVLTSGDELIIQGVSNTPSFDVSTGGSYTIHSLVYDSSTLDLGIVVPGETSGFDVNGLLIQGGGNICASLDVSGARFTVGPDAGTLIPLTTSGCTGSFRLEAGINSEPYIPEGYTRLFVLTEGANLVIQVVSENPVFEVSSTGTHTIHTLVYDPLTLDLGIVEFGVTTGVDVNGLLIQGGGSICASLDVAGAVFDATGPIAGTLSSEETLACFTGSPVSLNAQHVDEPITPAGYSVLYVLTQGDNLVIQQVGTEPSFEVTIAGNYTIHTLIYDENTLDLSIVVPGVTTGGDINGLLVQGGGAICAALDVAGSKISVGPTAGTLVADNPSPMLDGMGSAMLQASVGDDPVVPEGFSLIYVLTSGDGLVIQNVSATPIFEVSATGKYTIHTLVYDTSTLDLGIVEIGVTTGVDVNGLLVQGGGSICAALDVAGAVFEVSSAMSRSGLEIVNVWYHAGIIYAEVQASKPMLTPLQVFHPGGLEVVARRESVTQGYNLLEVTLAVENPSSLYFVKIENQVFKIMKDW